MNTKPWLFPIRKSQITNKFPFPMALSKRLNGVICSGGDEKLLFD